MQLMPVCLGVSCANALAFFLGAELVYEPPMASSLTGSKRSDTSRLQSLLAVWDKALSMRAKQAVQKLQMQADRTAAQHAKRKSLHSSPSLFTHPHLLPLAQSSTAAPSNSPTQQPDTQPSLSLNSSSSRRAPLRSSRPPPARTQTDTTAAGRQAPEATHRHDQDPVLSRALLKSTTLFKNSKHVRMGAEAASGW